MTHSRIRSYTELASIDDFEDRFHYLKLEGVVGRPTFGHERWLNQTFYRSNEWRRVRNLVIARDDGCDLGIPGYEVQSKLMIHHMNPMAVSDIRHGNEDILDPEYLITVSHPTHNAIHYGDEGLLPRPFVPRRRGDTTLWRR